MKQFKKLFTYSKISFGIIFYLILTFTAFSQQVTMSPFQIHPSDFETKILKFAEDNPKISNDELIKKANELIVEAGLNFKFAFDKTFCQKVLDFRNDKKNTDKPINLNAKLKSTDGDLTNVLLPNVRFPKSNCGNCYVEMPILSISNKTFITKIRGLNVKFDLPGNFYLSNASLVANDDFENVKNYWITPGTLEPFSLSSDDKIVYFDFPIGNFSDLVISETIKNNKNQGYLTIEKDKEIKTLRYSKICN